MTTTPDKNEERAAKEEALSKLYSPVITYFNTVLVVDPDNGAPREIEELRCTGHNTMEEALLCHDELKEQKREWAKAQVKAAQVMMDEVKALLQPHMRVRLGSFRFVVIKFSTEFMEEQSVD